MLWWWLRYPTAESDSSSKMRQMKMHVDETEAGFQKVETVDNRIGEWVHKTRQYFWTIRFIRPAGSRVNSKLNSPVALLKLSFPLNLLSSLLAFFCSSIELLIEILFFPFVTVGKICQAPLINLEGCMN